MKKVGKRLGSRGMEYHIFECSYPECTNTFERSKSKSAYYDKKYCSNECYNNTRNGRIKLARDVCLSCGQKLEGKDEDIIRYDGVSRCKDCRDKLKDHKICKKNKRKQEFIKKFKEYNEIQAGKASTLCD